MEYLTSENLLLFFLCCLPIFSYLILSRKRYPLPLPPGNYGWPLLGELLELQRLNRSGKPEEFTRRRMAMHGKEVFKTQILLGDRTAVLCGPAGNKFLFTSERKYVLTFWPPLLKKLFGEAFFTAPYEEAVRTRRVVTGFLKQEVVGEFVERFDRACKRAMSADWANKTMVMAFCLIKKYAFSIACEMFTGIQDPDHQARLLEEFNILLGGVFQMPIYLPGSRHYKAVKAAGRIRRELLKLIEEKKRKRDEESVDLISYLIERRDGEGRVLRDKEIADNIILLMDAGHDTSSSTMMMLMKYLAEFPDCYQRVLQEQREIASSKEAGELLNKGDITKMKYSWNVVSEVLRLSPPIQGTFREAITDFSYAGFFIPKGWKVWWTVDSTHKVEEYFPEPEKFDPMRFEGEKQPGPYTYVPFGGGPRMCPGREFARVEILVFLHNLVQHFRWELVFPDEKISVDPMPTPSMGLPLYLFPHSHTHF